MHDVPHATSDVEDGAVKGRNAMISFSPVLACTLDAISEALLVCDSGGGVLHANAALEALVRADPERARLLAEIRQVADEVAALGTSDGMAAVPVRRVVSTGRATYRLRGRHLGEDARHAGVAILVTVERATWTLPTEVEIRAQLRLTRKQAAVARLLAEGKANDALAAALYISPHTARRHTESVLKNLGLTSRAEVRPLLLRVKAEGS